MSLSRKAGITAGALLVGLLSIPSAPARAQFEVLYLNYNGGGISVLNDLLTGDARFNLAGSAARSDTPALADLLPYDVVLFATDAGPTAGVLDVLADYVDAGGAVVFSTFTGQTASSGTTGRILTSGYNPLTGPTFDAYNAQTLGTFNAAHPIFAGVTTLSSSRYNGDWTGVDAGASLIGSWATGLPLVAVNGAGNVAGVTLYPNVVNHGNATGDYRPLFANTLAFVAGAGVTAAAPEPGTLALAGFALLPIAAVARRRRRRK